MRYSTYEPVSLQMVDTVTSYAIAISFNSSKYVGFFLDKAHRVSLKQIHAEILFAVTKQLLQATLLFPLDLA